MNRLTAALIAYAVLGVLSWITISDLRIRAVPLGILAMFALKSVLRRHDVLHADDHGADEPGAEQISKPM